MSDCGSAVEKLLLVRLSLSPHTSECTARTHYRTVHEAALYDCFRPFSIYKSVILWLLNVENNVIASQLASLFTTF